MSGLYGSIASKDPASELPLLSSNDKPDTILTSNQSKKKNKSAFDEYEQRGGVLEEYEDLNSISDDEADPVLGELFADQHG